MLLDFVASFCSLASLKLFLMDIRMHWSLRKAETDISSIVDEKSLKLWNSCSFPFLNETRGRIKKMETFALLKKSLRDSWNYQRLHSPLAFVQLSIVLVEILLTLFRRRKVKKVQSSWEKLQLLKNYFSLKNSRWSFPIFAQYEQQHLVALNENFSQRLLSFSHEPHTQ